MTMTYDGIDYFVFEQTILKSDTKKVYLNRLNAVTYENNEDRIDFTANLQKTIETVKKLSDDEFEKIKSLFS